ncbi:MAG: ComF family protein [Clostridia bacterium]|nr:MAG: ComF family protein [Clostridia bacterium]
MRFFSALGSHIQPFLDVLFPPRCVYCGRLGERLCASCRKEAREIGRDICIRCGNPLTARGVCAHCRQDPPDPLKGIRGVFFYSGPIAQSIRSLKYHHNRLLAPILAEYLAAYITRHPIPIDALTPVPLHPERLAERGYNQSELLAASISQSLKISLRNDLLLRTRSTQPQARLDREQRLRNVAGAFSVNETAQLHGETILLIDDVATTGATLRACAHALRAAGAGDIWALTVARAPSHIVLPSAKQIFSPADAFLLWDSARRQKHPDFSRPSI